MNNKIIAEDLEFIVSHNLPWESFKNSTVLITGANGYLPAYMLETLLYLNDKYNAKIHVLALTRNKKRSFERFNYYKGRKDLEFLFQDVCDPLNIKKGRQLNYIIHAASQSNHEYYKTDPIGTLSANTIGTINLLKKARKESCKGFLYLSTGGVYGRVEDKNIPIKEDDYGYLDPTEVEACYNESKRMGENICVCWNYQYGIPTKVVRISYVYGPGMNLNDRRVFPAFIANIVKGRDIVMTSNGSDTRAFCYIADATVAFFTVLLMGKNAEVYNVGIEKETSVKELADLLTRSFPEKGLKVVKRQADKSRVDNKMRIHRSLFDISKIKALGWAPVFDLSQGCKRTVLSYGE